MQNPQNQLTDWAAALSPNHDNAPTSSTRLVAQFRQTLDTAAAAAARRARGIQNFAPSPLSFATASRRAIAALVGSDPDGWDDRWKSSPPFFDLLAQTHEPSFSPATERRADEENFMRQQLIQQTVSLMSTLINDQSRIKDIKTSALRRLHKLLSEIIPPAPAPTITPQPV